MSSTLNQRVYLFHQPFSAMLVHHIIVFGKMLEHFGLR